MAKDVTFTINRTGLCKTQHSSNNQCKSIGHKKYEYLVRVTVGNKLDKNGFVVDHIDIHNAVEEVFKEQVDSCERISLKIAKSVEDTVKKNKCKLKKVYVQLKPVLPKGKLVAYMETTIEY